MSHRITPKRSTVALSAVILTLTSTIVHRNATATDPPEPLPSIAETTAGMDAHPGFLPIYWDAREGKLYLELPSLDTELLYVVFLETGLGSNPVGLDRGQVGSQRIVRFERVGPRVRLVEPNQRYRADTADPDEARAVRESFATSTLWATDVVAETGDRVLVDVSDLCLADAHGIAQSLDDSDQGSFHLDTGRSAYVLDRTRAFPKNTEVSVELTFAGDDPGRHVRETTPTPQAVSLRLRHSFVALPEPGYEPRRFDPRVGGFYQHWADYAAPLDQPIDQRVIERHRLQKASPGTAASTPVEPIVYYVDRGAPEPVRSALLDGARWWSEAFEAAGFSDAYRVELLPEDADPLDLRYNVVQWVHRSTRGWSYGSTVVDPRTGEILKGHVTLGSLRVRQDRRIFEGLFGRTPVATELSLARIRQLAAHEVGHTLGFSHNFAASVNDRASVMDYPAPWIHVKDGELDASEAYGVGLGAWDLLAARYFYTQYDSPGEEEAGLRSILEEAANGELLFISDRDARPAGAGHPLANLWDNGTDPIASLEEILEVRQIALDRFGPQCLGEDRPLSELEDVLVPIYLLHRYQIDAVAKFVGGATYTYGVRAPNDRATGNAGAGTATPAAGVIPTAAVTPVAPDQQRRALDTLLGTLSVDELRLPASLLDAIPPTPIGFGGSRERFPRRTSMYFDPIAAARTAVDMTMENLFQYERAQRLIAQQWLDPTLPGFGDVLESLQEATWDAPLAQDAYGRALQREVQRAHLEGLIALAANTRASSDVRGTANEGLHRLLDLIEDRSAHDPEELRHLELADAEIRRFLDRPYDAEDTPRGLPAPPGSPIGHDRVSRLRCEF